MRKLLVIILLFLSSFAHSAYDDSHIASCSSIGATSNDRYYYGCSTYINETNTVIGSQPFGACAVNGAGCPDREIYFLYSSPTTCTGGRDWDSVLSSCQCPAGQDYVGGQCVNPDPCADNGIEGDIETPAGSGSCSCPLGTLLQNNICAATCDDQIQGGLIQDGGLAGDYCGCPNPTDILVDTDNDSIPNCTTAPLSGECNSDHPSYLGTFEGEPFCDYDDEICGANSSLGTVNGIYTCVDDTLPCPAGTVSVDGSCLNPTPDPIENPNSTEVTEHPDGTTTTTTSNTTNTTNNSNNQSTTTTTTVTTHADGSQTTTTTTETTDPQDDLGAGLNEIAENTAETNSLLEDLEETLGQEQSPLDGVANVGSMDDVLTNFSNTLNNAPIVSMASGLGDAFIRAETTCPTWSFSLATVITGTFVFDFHCSIWPQMAAIISPVMLLVWSILAIREVMRA